MMYPASEGHKKFLSQLEEQLATKFPEDQVQTLTRFANIYYASASLEELSERRPDDLYAATVSTWRFLQKFDATAPKVRVYNPDFEQDGWQSTHTVIEILQRDMPFLVDSIRVELKNRDITVHSIHNTVLNFVRDEQHQVQQFSSRNDQFSDELNAAAESLMYIEVDRHTAKAELDALRDAMIGVLREVDTAVADFDLMRNKSSALCEALAQSRPPHLGEADLTEAVDFLRWLNDEHFTYLGYDEYDVVEENGKRILKQVKGAELGILKLDDPRYRAQSRDGMALDARQLVLIPELLSFAKASEHARVHRPAYPDYITIKRFNAEGILVGESRFLGLFTASVYNESPRRMPILRKKINAVVEASGLDPNGHSGKHLVQILEVFPRDELIQTDTYELTETVLGILNIRERRRVRLFIRKDSFGKFFSCLVYMPRDIYCTELRHKVREVLWEELNATGLEFHTYFSESTLARTQYLLRFKGDDAPKFDVKAIEKRVMAIARSWSDDLYSALIEGYGEEKANHYWALYRDAFPGSYSDDFNSRIAVLDIGYIDQINDQQNVTMSFYRHLEADSQHIQFKLFHADEPLPLSDIIPVLENLGMRVVGEHPYEIDRSDGRTIWIHDFSLQPAAQQEVNLAQIKEALQDAFRHIWAGNAENDTFNRLVLTTGLPWRQVSVLRAYARYMKQIRFNFGQEYIAATLGNHPAIARQLVALFELRFNPEVQYDKEAAKTLRAEIIEALDQVQSLNEDLILRRYLDLIRATLRTNFYQTDASGEIKSYISFKLNTKKIPDVPLPRPMFEIFVYSPRVEGVHLRGGKVARGGLRWSDRHEDFRTEVLGLVKAQQVKNSVIVPVGAKGGFVCKRSPEGGDRDAILQEGIACYKIFINALLDITDNLVGGEVVPPKNVVRHDEDDPYLVVAADKGTATFSDIANSISLEHGFWLKDAFASGGANGYDHKKMGITARGAWVSVQRHFRELGHNVQNQDFTVVGIGDMAGDVFGNGMLLSEHIQLVAAFNHMHIFIDPNPASAASFKERRRLFDLPRSSWADYNANLISPGGGVFLRSAKFIVISPEMKARFAIKEDRMAPTDLITAILKAPVDLIWNGGIGTYAKSSLETHADAGDKANDALRINGVQVGAKVIGEGGNLGFTQRARIEYGLNGGLVNTDFIDNAGGVNCSDHEVNIKILLDEIVSQGDMTAKQRNELLEAMTEEVGALVLRNNYTQSQALSLAKLTAKDGIGQFRRFINALESEGKLNRELEFIPSDEALLERFNQGQGLTGSELSVLISYAKADLKQRLLASNVPDDTFIEKEMERAFPSVLMQKFKPAMYNHRLKREIVSTQLANDLVDHGGIAFIHRLIDSSGAEAAEIARAYVVAREVFGLNQLWQRIEALDYQVSSETQYDMMLDLMRLIRRATRWFLRPHLANMAVSDVIALYEPKVRMLSETIGERLRGAQLESWSKRRATLVEQGVPEALADQVAATSGLYSLLGVVEAERVTGEKLQRVAEVYFELGHQLDLQWVSQQITKLQVHDSWEALARETFRDDLDWQSRALAISVIQMEDGVKEVEERVSQWMARHQHQVKRWQKILAEISSGSKAGFPIFSVAMRELFDLAQVQLEA
ncbi:glutamate dehydrogenase (NAD) [Oceanospirillum multiglobuliferum]|uniref:NAD-glutamate dehydrogenase n=1 Tax=Oceanospirillum multiglobuliferum TaxID=64969 RepID=A0A1T4LGM8_9GAMM|nr:NAD-glutamate dehydrogenase [Oceanospirillum multiglobuliferum]OPX56667.1 NAD-glutamate dehydrogenase [Oceanospirillum multiglobuliferum]SJZ53810.1 glutamate dehydrogenase (NAD) [Oceanospirillum multiglobuliferum]